MSHGSGHIIKHKIASVVENEKLDINNSVDNPLEEEVSDPIQHDINNDCYIQKYTFINPNDNTHRKPFRQTENQ